MHKDILPTKVDPFRFAENGHTLRGQLSIQDLPRLCSSVYLPSGEVDVELQFGKDEQGIYYIKGKLATRVTLQCQRCMQPFEYAIISNFKLGIVRTEEKADQLPPSFEPWVVVDESLVVSDVVEEELLVSLPIVPMHNETECQVRLPLSSSDKPFETERENPFKVIEMLRTKRNLDDK